MFTLEAWIKMDLVDPPIDGLIMPIFGKYTSTDHTNEYKRTYKIGFAVNAYFLRVYFNSLHYDVSYYFIDEP